MAEDDLFGRAMKGVRRIKTESRKQVAPRTPPLPRQNSEPLAGGVSAQHQHDAPHRTGDPWVLKSNGISADRMRQLTGGRMSSDDEIDLHGMTRSESLAALQAFFSSALASGYRVLSIVHGRGLHSKDDKPVLKAAVYDWLESGEFAGAVLAVVPKPGSGGGSCLVLLRRNRAA